MSLSEKFLRDCVSLAEQAILRAAKNSLKHFENCPRVETKPDRSPVTQADQEAESIIRESIRNAYSEHKICGEEFPDEGPTESDFRWLIDPIDGTLQFIRGLPRWGSLLALEYQGEVVAGAIYHPVIDWGLSAFKGGGCSSRQRKVRVSKIDSIEEASIVYGSLRGLPTNESSSFLRLLDKAWDDRGLGDSYGHSLVITGQAEAMVDFKVKDFDIAPIKICIEEAGGSFSDFKGQDRLNSGNAVSSNGPLHGHILEYLS